MRSINGAHGAGIANTDAIWTDADHRSILSMELKDYVGEVAVVLRVCSPEVGE